ncbi:tellurite resistance TerB family protein [Streptomyces sp. MAR4 CNX-425]|uniref:tellurite resistance TerB family protein n=1 Tax=Streptomyces sp. MAR4 CNX-425 TaxID=3406343 RepID=UPI003B50C50E
MFDRIKDQAKGLQQSRGGGARPGGTGSGGTGSGGGSKAQLMSLFKSQLSSMKSELKSGAYRDASMAVCALVAAADGHVHPAERERMDSLIVSNDVLQNFPPEQLRQRFTQHLDRLTVNFQQGKAEAMQEIAKAKKKPAEARAVIQTGFVIAGADGHTDPAEQQVLREACTALGLPPSEFGL